ncbi:hypothetical protein LMG28727_06861 [Paraburkholderia kirstenboschensis]|uniref:hypothetical protein n=1 Tax=Paraburkholderia kirstenboschensis TaxID=1245436 RepID=UPI000AC91C70|nr:hypothetical protein [Paraburkholderia kirstenboschensis]CAD6559471.1 hypothetical protein LMG28727_06861 [Paraburkholderia kirstenboschensis]
MEMPDYLMASESTTSVQMSRLIGETGISFRESERPNSALTSWIHAETIPETARSVLQSNGQFEGLTGLIRVLTEADAFGRFRAGWILGRTTDGLTSIVVRDANHCSTKTLLDDAAFAVRQAARYCATSAVILVQQNDSSGSRPAREALESAFMASDVQADVLYDSQLHSEIRVSFARLS